MYVSAAPASQPLQCAAVMERDSNAGFGKTSEFTSKTGVQMPPFLESFQG
jgi:hypothetical protein